MAAYKDILIAYSWRAEKAEVQEQDLIIILEIAEFQRKLDYLSCQIYYTKSGQGLVRSGTLRFWDEDVWINEFKILWINALKIPLNPLSLQK